MRTRNGIPPQLICPQHRTGEHSEIHKYLPSLLKNHSIRGRYLHKDGRKRYSPQIELCTLRERHDILQDALVKERFLEDDSVEHVKKVTFEFMGYDKKGKATMEVSEYERT